MEFKFIIIGPEHRSLKSIIGCLEIKNNNFIIAKHFINDIQYENTENDDWLYYLDNNTITSALKNNSILYVCSDDNNISGITLDEFYNANIVSMSISDFNNISTNFLINNKDNFLIVWLDTKYHINTDILNKEINEVNYLLEKINEHGFKYIYLLDENQETISDIILTYYLSDNDNKEKILEEYS